MTVCVIYAMQTIFVMFVYAKPLIYNVLPIM